MLPQATTVKLCNVRALALVLALAVALALPTPAVAVFLPVYGTYDQTTGNGYLFQNVPPDFVRGPGVGNGVAVGSGFRIIGGTPRDVRTIRWDACGTAATELGNLGGYSYPYATNTAGTAVGFAVKWTGGTNLGERAVRWHASGTAATELGNLGTDGSGFTVSNAEAINDAGAAVGYARKYTGGMLVGDRAVLWDPVGRTFDLNTLVDPSSGWILNYARGISDSNWVSGTGSFDPDGAGPLVPYDVAFLQRQQHRSRTGIADAAAERPPSAPSATFFPFGPVKGADPASEANRRWMTC